MTARDAHLWARLAELEAKMRNYLTEHPSVFSCSVSDPKTLQAVATAMGASWINADRIVAAHAYLAGDLGKEISESGNVDTKLATVAAMLFDWLDAAGYQWDAKRRRMVERVAP